MDTLSVGTVSDQIVRRNENLGYVIPAVRIRRPGLKHQKTTATRWNRPGLNVEQVRIVPAKIPVQPVLIGSEIIAECLRASWARLRRWRHQDIVVGARRPRSMQQDRKSMMSLAVSTPSAPSVVIVPLAPIAASAGVRS